MSNKMNRTAMKDLAARFPRAESPAPAFTESRKAYTGTHILTDDYAAGTDTWVTGVNNNVLIFGPSGAGKTRHYVKPNLAASHESMIISDTKGSLFAETGPLLKERGFDVFNIDFTDLSAGTGYNPLDYIRYNEKTCRYSEKDILTLASCFIGKEDVGTNDPFWSLAARQYLVCLISYVLEICPAEDHSLETVARLTDLIGTEKFEAMMEEFSMLKPTHTAPLRYKTFKENRKADKMDASIRGIMSTFMDPLIFDEALAMYKKPGRIDFAALGRKKTALFLTISDTDRSMDRLASMFMTQAIQELCRAADKDTVYHRLAVPVRFYLDDFATNLYIPDFDKIISVIRSREISVSVILQSMTQLVSLYGEASARTIMNNCDRQLYLGGQDIDTASYISQRTNKALNTILALPVDTACLLMRGEQPQFSRKFSRVPELAPQPDPSRPSRLPAQPQNACACGIPDDSFGNVKDPTV